VSCAGIHVSVCVRWSRRHASARRGRTATAGGQAPARFGGPACPAQVAFLAEIGQAWKFSTARRPIVMHRYWIARKSPVWMSEVARAHVITTTGRPSWPSLRASRRAHRVCPLERAGPRDRSHPTRCTPATPSLAPHLCLRIPTLCRRGVVRCSTRRSDRHGHAAPLPTNESVVMCRRERTRYTRCGHCYTYTRTCCPLPDFTQPGCKDPVTREETVHDDDDLCVGCAIDNLIAGTKD